MKLSAMVLLLVAHTAAAERVRHVPPADAEAGTEVALVAEAGAGTPTLTAHVRTRGERQFHAIELQRQDDARWIAVVPGTEVTTPGLEYFLDAGGQPVFASAELPHTLPVHLSAEADRRDRDLARARNRRSRIHTMGEYVTYGSPRVQGMKLADRYYRIDADFTYKLLAYPLEDIRVGYTRLIGDTPASMCATPEPCTQQGGFKVGGWFELGLAAIEGIRLDTRAIMMATQTGFALGGRVEARLGMLEASHVAAGVEYLDAVGTSAYFRLGWGTVPGLPMAATVEVTNLPSNDAPLGVRLYYDIARDVGQGVRVGARVGYAARNQSVAGFTGGAGVTVDF